MARYIDADRIIVNAIQERKFIIQSQDVLHNHDFVIQTAYADLAEFIASQPTADVVEVKHGKWLLDGRCSECLDHPLTTHKSYCPNCGAKMDGGKK